MLGVHIVRKERETAVVSQICIHKIFVFKYSVVSHNENVLGSHHLKTLNSFAENFLLNQKLKGNLTYLFGYHFFFHWTALVVGVQKTHGRCTFSATSSTLSTSSHLMTSKLSSAGMTSNPSSSGDSRAKHARHASQVLKARESWPQMYCTFVIRHCIFGVVEAIVFLFCGVFGLVI